MVVSIYIHTGTDKEITMILIQRFRRTPKLASNFVAAIGIQMLDLAKGLGLDYIFYKEKIAWTGALLWKQRHKFDNNFVLEQ